MALPPPPPGSGGPPTPTQRETRKVPLYSTSHIKQTNVSVLYQGEPGSGKTHCMATWPNPLFLYFDTNLSTLAKFDGIPYVTIQDWAEVESLWLPAIKNRRLSEYVQGFVDENGQRPYENYKVRTLCIDSLTFCVNKNVLELGDGGAKSLGYDGWDTYYGRLHRLLTVATQATLPINARPDAETYHVLASVHEDKLSNDDGVVTELAPSIQGKMRGHVQAFFNAVLLTEKSTVRGVGKDNKPLDPTEEFHVWSVSPSRLRKSKDQVSGGKFGRLPAKVIGTYPELNKHWGLEKAPPEVPKTPLFKVDP